MVARIASNSIVRYGRALLVTVNGLALLLMTLFTTLDVVARYFFNSPLESGVELVRLTMAIMIFAGLPVATARREHVTVGLMENVFRGKVAIFRQFVVDLIGASLLSALALYVWFHAERLARFGETMMFLDVMVAPFAYLIAFFTGLSALILFFLAMYREDR